MKKIGAIVMLAAILCGCSQTSHLETAPEISTPKPAVTKTAGLFYDTAIFGEGLAAYPLYLPDCTGLIPMGEGLLVISSSGTGSRLTKLTGDPFALAAEREIPGLLPHQDPSLQVYPERVSYFDRDTRETVVLDILLREGYRIAAPEGLTGIPLLSRDGEMLFYCTENAIRCLDLKHGISRILKENSQPNKTLQALLLGEQVLQLQYSDEYWGNRWLFLSTKTGQTLAEESCSMSVFTGTGNYFASYPNGSSRTLVFGAPEGDPRELRIDPMACDYFYLPSRNDVLTVTPTVNGSAMELALYNLNTGLQEARLTLATDSYPWNFAALGEDQIYFTLYDDDYRCTVLVCWKPDEWRIRDPACYESPHYTRTNPDFEGLSQCAEKARELSSRYGIEVLIWKDAVDAEPWDFQLEEEYLVPVIRQELTLLEQRLQRYPPGFLKTLAQCCGSLKIALVRSITAAPDSRNVASANGVQFWQEDGAYIALAMGYGSETALYHELCHIIDTQVLNESNAYDSWDQLNPRDFEYDYDYLTNQQRESYEYLQEHCRSFIDMYSMSFPKEDRARIMEHAMMPGNEYLFRSPILQSKLALLCIGIREAFGLDNHSDPLPWEAYLQNPLY